MATTAPSPRSSEPEIVLHRPTTRVFTRQALDAFVGISAETAGATGISMNLVVIPPGGTAAPHLHRGFESAIYLLAGQVETRYGSGLSRSMTTRAGDFLFIPADVPHQPINLSEEEPALAIVARNTPSEQESVVHYGNAPQSVA